MQAPPIRNAEAHWNLRRNCPVFFACLRHLGVLMACDAPRE